jgi:hypothetical protein
MTHYPSTVVIDLSFTGKLNQLEGEPSRDSEHPRYAPAIDVVMMKHG